MSFGSAGTSQKPERKSMSLWMAQICCVYAYDRALTTRGHERAWNQNVDYCHLDSPRRCEWNEGAVKGLYICLPKKMVSRCPKVHMALEDVNLYGICRGFKLARCHIMRAMIIVCLYFFRPDHSNKSYHSSSTLQLIITKTLKWRLGELCQQQHQTQLRQHNFLRHPHQCQKRMPKSVLGSSTESSTRGIPCHAWKRKAMGRAPGGSLAAVHDDTLKKPLTKRQKRNRRKYILLASFREWAPSMDPGFENGVYVQSKQHAVL